MATQGRLSIRMDREKHKGKTLSGASTQTGCSRNILPDELL
jgi:hypothetical protein